MGNNRQTLYNYMNTLSNEEVGDIASYIFRNTCQNTCPIANYCSEEVQGKKRMMAVGGCRELWTKWLSE